MAAALDPRFVVAPSLEMLFNDKSTALPMAAGIVTFFSDVNRDVKKAIYKLDEITPGTFTYTQLPNPIILNADGSFSDNEGNNILPYYYPFEGEPADNSTIQELYHITVVNSELEEQFTRNAWPNIADTGGNGSSITLTNYIPNGQLLIHNDVPFVPNNQVGQVVGTEFEFAPGGFFFERTSDASTDLLTFSRLSSFTSNPTSSPRYQLEIVCTIAASNTKSINIRFNNVNKFSSSLLGTLYTFGFNAESGNTASIPLTATFLKNFGSGGSPDVLITIPLNAPNATPSAQAFYGSFSPGDNSIYTIGPNDDDFCELIINLPSDATFDLLFTDFILTPGNINNPTFPVTPDAKFTYQGVAGGLPIAAYDGSDLYLRIVYKQNGFAFDDSEIGKIYACGYEISDAESSTTNDRLCQGAKYITAAYSSLGIPNSRLFNKIFNTTYFYPLYGTGLDYVFAVLPNDDSSDPTKFTFHNNTLGATTPTVDVNTGFAIQQVFAGSATHYCSAVETESTGEFAIINTNVGAVTAATAGNTAFPFSVLRVGSTTNQNIVNYIVNNTPSFLQNKYFTFSSYNSGDTPFYVWFLLDGAGTDPAPGGTPIPVNLTSTDSVVSTSRKIQDAINGFNTTTVTVNASSTISLQNKYFTFFATGGQYFVWYNVDGGGTKPAGTGTAIEVSIQSSNNNEDIAIATISAMNSYSYQVPDLRGYSLKGFDASGTVDTGIRYSINQNGAINNIGSYEFDNNLSHIHGITYGEENDSLLRTVVLTGDIVTGADQNQIKVAAPVATDYDGWTEVDVKNMVVNFVIKY